MQLVKSGGGSAFLLVECQRHWLAEFEYQGNGSGRAMSYTDIVLRRRGVSDKNNQSRLILGVVEVKGSWQLDLPDNTDLVTAQREPEVLKTFLSALQQVSLPR